MATITGLTAERMKQIEAACVVDGEIQGDNLVLTRHDGTPIQAGNVRGPQGIQGIPGSISVSPAGGVLAGSYPNPSFSAGVMDADPGVASLRSLGNGSRQAAPGNHKLLQDSGWVDFTPKGGDTPFSASTSTVVRAQYRKIGPHVHVRITKNSGTETRDMRSNTTGNFPNLTIMAQGSVPTVACPAGTFVTTTGSFLDTPVGVVLSTAGAVVWTGGFPRLYPANSAFTVDFVFFTDN